MRSVADEERQRVLLDHQLAAEARQRLGLGTRPGRFGRTPRRELHETADHPRHQQEHDQRDEVLPLVDRELVEGRDEVEVGQKECDDARTQRRPHTADSGDRDDSEQVNQQRGGQVDAVPHAGHDDGQQGEEERAQHCSGDLTSHRECSAAPGPAKRGFSLRLLTRDHVHVDGAGLANHTVDHRAPGELDPARPAAGTEDELRGVLGARKLDQGLADVVTDDLVVRASQLGQQRSVLVQELFRRAGEPVVGAHMHAEELGVRAHRHPRRTPDERFPAGCTGDRDDGALAGLPRTPDPVVVHVVLQRLVDLVGHPEQGELPEGGEVAGSEVVGERGVDPLGRVDVAVGHAATERLRRHVDQLDLLRGSDDGVRNGLVLLDAGDPLYDIVDRLEVLHVQCRDNGDTGLEQLVDVLPPLLVPRAGDVRVGDLVDQHELRFPGEDGIDVHLLEFLVPVLDLLPGYDLEVADLRFRIGASVGLDVAHDDIFPRCLPRQPSLSMAKVLPTPGAAPRYTRSLPRAMVKAYDACLLGGVEAIPEPGLGREVSRPRVFWLELPSEPGDVLA